MTDPGDGDKPVKVTGRFKRDLRRVSKQGRNLGMLQKVVDTLVAGDALAEHHRPHRLKGIWKPCWECHIQPDWLLVWDEDDDCIILIRTGSHAELFG